MTKIILENIENNDSIPHNIGNDDSIPQIVADNSILQIIDSIQ